MFRMAFALSKMDIFINNNGYCSLFTLSELHVNITQFNMKERQLAPFNSAQMNTKFSWFFAPSDLYNERCSIEVTAGASRQFNIYEQICGAHSDKLEQIWISVIISWINLRTVIAGVAFLLIYLYADSLGGIYLSKYL